MSRPKLPQDLRFNVLYKSARTCCVCRIPGRPVQIHHIDKNNSNNVEANLVAICQNCHDEAHTKHDLSQNLTDADIRQCKERWEKEVDLLSKQSMLPSSNADQALWTYFNHDRLHSFLDRAGLRFDSSRLSRLQSIGAVDEFGIIQPLEQPSENRFTWTVYDYLPHHLGYPVYYLFAQAVDQLVLSKSPIDLDAIWTRTELKALLTPGTYIFSLRGFYFKDIDTHNDRHYSTRLCYAQKKRIRVEFRVKTRDMFGDSSIYDSFSGHRVAAVLLIFKSFSEADGVLIVHCTPVAMGMGFLRDVRESPHHVSDNVQQAADVSADASEFE